MPHGAGCAAIGVSLYKGPLMPPAARSGRLSYLVALLRPAARSMTLRQRIGCLWPTVGCGYRAIVGFRVLASTCGKTGPVSKKRVQSIGCGY